MTESAVIALPRRGSEPNEAAPALRNSQDALFEPTPLGLKINGTPTFEEWNAYGHGLGVEHDSLPFRIADWLIAGDRFGEQASQALGGHYSPFTLVEYRRICERFPLERRWDGLTMGHYQAVRKLDMDEATTLLARAAKEGWPREALRAEVRERRGARERAANPSNGEPAHDNPRETGNTASEQDQSSTAHNLKRDMTADEAVDLLVSLPAGALPDNIMDAILALTEERTKLLPVLRAAQLAAAAFDLPALSDALDEYRSATP